MRGRQKRDCVARPRRYWPPSERDREALTRFYLQKQSAETICAEMGLPTTQFRLLKSRAKARFAKLDKTRLVQKTLRESVQ